MRHLLPPLPPLLIANSLLAGPASNAEQLAVVQHPLDEPLLVLACAGTGARQGMREGRCLHCRMFGGNASPAVLMPQPSLVLVFVLCAARCR